jgi:uncharacterized RDD family membrane protein YckC
MKHHRPKTLRPHYFSAHETKRLRSLDGIRLASFRARGFAIVFDLFVIVLILLTIAIFVLGIKIGSNNKFNTSFGSTSMVGVTNESDGHENTWVKYGSEFGIPILYWGLLTYFTNGRTPGKWFAGIRVVSTTHDRIRLWQSIERALGYSVSTLEAGLGFFQYFISTNRRATHDRLAETVVICDPDRRLFRNGNPFRRMLHR